MELWNASGLVLAVNIFSETGGASTTKPKTKENQTFHYTRRITPKRVKSLRCPNPRHRPRQYTYLRRR